MTGEQGHSLTRESPPDLQARTVSQFLWHEGHSSLCVIKAILPWPCRCKNISELKSRTVCCLSFLCCCPALCGLLDQLWPRCSSWCWWSRHLRDPRLHHCPSLCGPAGLPRGGKRHLDSTDFAACVWGGLCCCPWKSLRLRYGCTAGQGSVIDVREGVWLAYTPMRWCTQLHTCRFMRWAHPLSGPFGNIWG